MSPQLVVIVCDGRRSSIFQVHNSLPRRRWRVEVVFLFFIDGRASLQILSLLREGRRSEVTKVEENGLKDFFFFSIVIESLRWSENESRNNLLRFPARIRPPGSCCYLRRRRRRFFSSCPRHRWQWFELWKIYVRIRYATTKTVLALCMYTFMIIAILRLF